MFYFRNPLKKKNNKYSRIEFWILKMHFIFCSTMWLVFLQKSKIPSHFKSLLYVYFISKNFIQQTNISKYTFQNIGIQEIFDSAIFYQNIIFKWNKIFQKDLQYLKKIYVWSRFTVSSHMCSENLFLKLCSYINTNMLECKSI